MNNIDKNIKLENCLNEAVGLLTQSVKLADSLYADIEELKRDYQILKEEYKSLQGMFERSIS